MRFFSLLLITVCLLIIIGCRSVRQSTGNLVTVDDAIKTVIDDFSRNTRLYKKNTVFSVSCFHSGSYADLIVIRVGTNPNRMIVDSNVVIGSNGNFASRYLEKEGKLFFWNDSSYALTKDALETFRKYDLLVEMRAGDSTYPFFTRIKDESIKAAHYYFCKSNLNIYKRVITNIGIGYYQPPDLKCNASK